MHYGRDALTGTALFLSYLALRGDTVSGLRAALPEYHMSKNKIPIGRDTDVEALLEKVKDSYTSAQINTSDGVKIDIEEGWIHLRKSNTESIIRIYTEAGTKEQANKLADDVTSLIQLF
jgi:phosphomannomutase